jgi:uncharacterized protein (UPF0297 family)
VKVALCFYGQPRYIRECAEAIKANIITPLNPDIYYHLWWDPTYIGQSFKFHATDKYQEDMSAVFKETYPAAVGIFEPQIIFDISQYSTQDGEQASHLSIEDRELWCKEVIFKQKSAFYSIREAVKQIHNIGSYDYVILTRVDVVPTQTISIDMLYKYLSFDTYNNLSHLADWFICGSPELIKRYSDIYDAIDDTCLNQVLTTTTLIKRCWQPFGFQTIPFLVNIYRNYKEPTKMSDYFLADNSNFPFWMKS